MNLALRIAFGGGAACQWRAELTLDRGTLAELRPLGMEADEPGSMWLESPAGQPGTRLVIQQRSPRTFDGVDLHAECAPEARLSVKLVSREDPQHPITLEVPIKEVLEGYYNRPLDDSGNRILIHRTPGDSLRVRFDRDHLVFAPEERFRFEVEPHLLPVAPGSKVQVRLALRRARGGEELWATEHSIQAGVGTNVPGEVVLPAVEGVYDLVLTVTPDEGWANAVRRPLAWRKPIAQRIVQLVVIGPEVAEPPASGPTEWTEELSIDPANPRWWERLGKLPHFARNSRLSKQPLGNGTMHVWHHSLGDVARLAPSSESPDLSWQAYTLPISEPGRPHLLEIAYPSDVAQTLGISVLEPNATGALMPVGLDSGVVVEVDELADRPTEWLHHRLVFWPRTENPILLMVNHRRSQPAVYGTIRVLSGPKHLASAFPRGTPAAGRMVAAYYHRPLFPENFGAREAFDGFSGHSLDDWMTFYEGGSRLVEYLNYVGYNAVVLSALADGSTIFPADQLQPTPRYDKGALFGTGQDPVRKDVLEMLFRMFDRERLQLVPALDFSAPLPELEAELRSGGAARQGMQWIGPQGVPHTELVPPERGAAPYYNPLHPRVQEAILRVIDQVANRYAAHPSFGGVALQISAESYAHLLSPEWGVDDATITRFEQDSGLKVPGDGPDRFVQRAAFLAGRHRELWLRWRARQISDFYRRAQEKVAAVRPDARLYLTAAGLLGARETEYRLRPTLVQRTTMAEVMLEEGLDAEAWKDQPGIVLLRPEWVISGEMPALRAAAQRLARLPDADHFFQQLPVSGSLFFHRPQQVRLASFDQQSPIQPSYTWLTAQPALSQVQNRARLAHALAAFDAQVLADGGWMLPMGQEESMRQVVAVCRHLPAVRFEKVESDSEQADSQPVTFRFASSGGMTYLYAVNDAPFATSARIRVQAPAGCRIDELTGLRRIAPLRKDGEATYWSVDLGPYEVVAVRFSASEVAFSQPRARWPQVVEAELGRRIRLLGAKAAALRQPPPLGVLDNAGFERRPTSGEEVPGWAITRQPDSQVQTDTQQHHGGTQCVHMASSGPVTCLVSRAFRAPETGRLAMSVWLRVADERRQPPLRLAIEGKLDGQNYYCFAPVGRGRGEGPPAPAIATEWRQFIFQVDDLPLDGLTQMRVRFDLMGPGEIWVDDVQLFDLAFNEKELRELAKLITVAEFQLQNGRLSDCLRILDGYWARFLDAHVPLDADAVAARPAATARQAPPNHTPKKQEPPPRTGWIDRVRGLLTRPARF